MAGHGTHLPAGTVDVELDDGEHIHMPGPSIWPFLVAFFLFVAMIGMVVFPHAGSDAPSWLWVVTGILFIGGAIGMGWSIVSWGVMVSDA